MNGNNVVTDINEERKFFNQSPTIVWAKCDNVYEYSLWNVIKMVAGESGECYLSTDDLAALSMMSAGKVSQCRKSLIEKGLIKGEVRKDPGYPQPVWHISIPKLWKENIAWAEDHYSLKDRVEFKRNQRSEKELKKSLHHMKPSPHEEGTSPHEEGTSPHETNKNKNKNKKEDGGRETLPSNSSTINRNGANLSVSGKKRRLDPMQAQAAERNGYRVNGNGRVEKNADDPDAPEPKLLTALAHEYERLAKVSDQIEAEMKVNRKQESSTRRIVREKAEALYHLGYKTPGDYAAVESALFGKTVNAWKVYDAACTLRNESQPSGDPLVTIKPGLYGGYTDKVLWED